MATRPNPLAPHDRRGVYTQPSQNEVPPPSNYSSSKGSKGSKARNPSPPTRDVESDEEGGKDRLASVQSQVDNVKQSLQKNIELAMERGEKLEEIENKSENFLNDANQFNQSAKNIRAKFCRRHYKMIAVIVILILIVILIIIISSTSNN
jgi:hypothetical protein